MASEAKKITLHSFLFMSVCLVIFIGIIAAGVFFVAVRGAEQTLVPDVLGKELPDALLILQERELYPRIQLRYSRASADKGMILEQDPPKGTIVKAGRRIKLIVSNGAIINRVENYINRNINEVRIDIQTLSAAAGTQNQPLLSLKEPFMYEYSAAQAGTILQQKPEPGASISGPTVLEFVISRGPEHTALQVPVLTGLSLPAALETISRYGINFAFAVRPPREGERPETVVHQTPAAQSPVSADTPVYLTYTAPLFETDGEVFGLFKYQIPRNPYPLPVHLEAVLPSGERRVIISTAYIGGEFTVPYRLPPGSLLILSMLNRELYRETVVAVRDDLTEFLF
ncbi:MAG: PASTA domain-containing protein [Spirochaetaceae bacterium]|jgi:beta-lactam-binding protein with PASTA domain|nr:PASTA domain-containing protein [Spirochaetaceae bacterium]